jgi:FkbM family methyltransferase
VLEKLRPSKVRTALRRRQFEFRLDRMTPDPYDGEVLELGSSYGFWTIPTAPLDESWVCYCVGAGGDVSFERELLDRYGVATVRSFEPDPEYIGRIEVEPEHRERFTVHELAIASSDGPIRMQRTHIPGSRSLSPVDLYDTSDYVEMPGRTLPSLMEELGDERIDLLKMDVEGGEYELLPTLDLSGMGVRIFCIQLHHTGSVRDARGLVELVRGQGFRLVVVRPTVRLTFLRD